MLKRFVYFILIFFSLFLSSCKKDNYHKIKFEVVFIQDCDNCYADYFAVNCTPHYSDEEPGITASQVTTGYVWTYEYWKLKNNDEVVFSVSPTGEGYHYRMNVYVDDVLVSYRECYGPYGTVVIDQGGINNSQQDMGVIEFTYHE
jgi:hypothetical protein